MELMNARPLLYAIIDAAIVSWIDASRSGVIYTANDCP